MRVFRTNIVSEIAGINSSAALPRFKPADFENHHADIHLYATGTTGQAEARCSLWWKNAPAYQQHRVGVIGHYAAANDEAAAALLSEVEECLREAGCTLAVGPMNGNTWRSYRFVTEAGDQPAFFLEPANPAEWPAQFEKAGFSSLASYFSALNPDLSRPDARSDVAEKRMAEAGVKIRPSQSDVRNELAAIYSVSKISFTQNFLYTEIPEAEFVTMYEPVLPMARPELILLAERDGECVGYVFAVPDFAQAARGPLDTFIIKTVAILPRPELRGLGTLLVARAHAAGRDLGFRRCIHALMFENNISLNISRHYATVMRKYTLYSKELAR
jgi:GNAT superfamily N-acetyltransferase